jgi:hypothetical protein
MSRTVAFALALLIGYGFGATMPPARASASVDLLERVVSAIESIARSQSRIADHTR